MPAKIRFDRPIAHRGLHDRARGVIENSRSAFEAAIAAGYPIECDVQLSRDGIPVVFHDDDTERLTGVPGPITQKTAAEITALPLLGSADGDRPQLFTDFLAQIAGRMLLQIELKRQSRGTTDVLARRVVEALRTYEGPYCLESFDPHLVTAAKSQGAKCAVGIITYRYDEPDYDSDLSAWRRLVLRHLLHWPLTRFDFISCDKRALDLPLVKLLRTFGMPVTSWTIKTPAEAVAAKAAADQIVFEGFIPQT